MYHTIGQRQGLGIGGPKPATIPGTCSADRNNVLLVGQGNDHRCCSPAPCWPRESTGSTRSNWSGRAACGPRYRQSDQDCVLEKLPKATARCSTNRSAQ